MRHNPIELEKLALVDGIPGMTEDLGWTMKAISAKTVPIILTINVNRKT